MKQLVINQPERIGQWVAGRAGVVWTPKDYALGVEEAGKIIVGVLYNQYYVGGSVAMHMAAETGSRWAQREFIKHAFIYPFEQLQVNKLIGYVREDNTAARRVDEHLGFVLETRIKNACAGGDILVYTMTREQCRYL